MTTKEYTPIVSEVDDCLNNLAFLISYIRDDVNIGDSETLQHHVKQLQKTVGRLKKTVYDDLDKIAVGDIY